MIVKLKGFIEDWFEDFVDLDVKGVVYRVFVPKKNIKENFEKGSLATFFIIDSSLLLLSLFNFIYI